MFALFTLAGVLLDLLVQMFTVMAAGAVVAMLVRGEPAPEWWLALLFVAIALGGLTLLGRRIWRTRRVLEIVRAGREEISTVTWLHFVLDAAWLALSVWMIVGAQAPRWDRGTRAAAVTVLVVCVGLCSLRVAARVRAARA
jgi:hypothetical protein